MTQIMEPAAATVVNRLSRGAAEYTCPLCGAEFTTKFGLWPYLAGSTTPLCSDDCAGEDAVVSQSTPCDTLFVLAPLSRDTLEAIGRTDDAQPVAERLRVVACDQSLPVEDRDLLCRAAIDLAFCEADGTRIRSLAPELVLETCGEAAAEMLLSGIGDVV